MRTDDVQMADRCDGPVSMFDKRVTVVACRNVESSDTLTDIICKASNAIIAAPIVQTSALDSLDLTPRFVHKANIRAAARYSQTLRDPRVGSELQRFTAVRYDADRGEGKAVAQRFGVRGFPGFVVLDGSGRKIDEFAGFRTADQFLLRLRQYR